MKNNQKIWFTSDNHFGHKAILNFCRDSRHGNNPDEMNELIIAQWNSQVALADIVYCLGDFSFLSAQKTEGILKRLNGRIHLIQGNHDYFIDANTSKYFESISSYKEVTIDGILVVMSHYPFAEWNKGHYGSYHLYGHLHNKKVNADPARRMDVGIDARPQKDMGLFSWEEIKEFLEPLAVLSHH